MISTNNNAIFFTSNNNARYVTYDVSEEKVNNIPYFDKLGKIVDDKEVQLLFYKDMIQRYEKIKNTFNANDKPMTQTRKIKIIEGLF